MTQHEQNIFDTQIKGLNIKLAWYFLSSFAAGICVVLGCYFGLKEDMALMKKDIGFLQEQVKELKEARNYNVTKN